MIQAFTVNNMVLFSQQREGSFSFPEQASNFAVSVDNTYAAIFWVSLLFFVAVNGVMVYFVAKYRRKDGKKAENSPSHNLPMELAWTILPSLILVVMFVQGALGYLEMRIPPESANAVERTIEVKAFKYGWQFIYPNGDITSELHLAQNVPVRFKISAKDALHSFFIREFRIKMDCVPGRYTECWVTPTMTRTPSECVTETESGEIEKGPKEPFHLQCAEYCGQGHSQMRTEWKEESKSWAFPVYVHDLSFEELEVFTRWKTGEHTPWKNGEFYFNAYGCVGCHAIGNNAQKIGPNFQSDGWNIGGKRDFSNGESITFDSESAIDNYISESINYSTKLVVKGYPNQMPKFEFDQDTLGHLIAFIRSPEAEPTNTSSNPSDSIETKSSDATSSEENK